MYTHPALLMLQIKQRHEDLIAEAAAHKLRAQAKAWRRERRAREARLAAARVAEAAALATTPEIIEATATVAAATTESTATVAAATIVHTADDLVGAGTLATCEPHAVGSVR